MISYLDREDLLLDLAVGGDHLTDLNLRVFKLKVLNCVRFFLVDSQNLRSG